MKLILSEPTKLRLICDAVEEKAVRNMLKYQNQKILQQIQRLKQNSYFSQRNGSDWVNRAIDELKQQILVSLVYEDQDGIYTLPGLKERLIEAFHAEFESQVYYPEAELIPWAKIPPYTPKDYQSNSVEALIKNPHAHVELATGLGKTFTTILLTKEMGLPTIITTPSQGLAKALYNEMKDYFGGKRVGLYGAGKKEVGKHILIAVGKSMSMVQPADYKKFEKYQVFISDESHTLPADQFAHFTNGVLAHCPYRWFFSATQERNDGKDLLLEGIIGPRVYEKGIREAIAEGHLAKITTMIVDVQSDKSYVSKNAVLMNQKHLYQNEQIVKFIGKVVNQAMDKNMPTLILIDEHAQEALLKAELGDMYTYAHGNSDTEKICNDFNAGKIMCVVGTAAVSVGTNFKPVKLTINWKGSKAGTKVKQGAIGRSTRLDSDKKECKIIDFRLTNVPMLKRHADARIVHYKHVGPVTFVEI